MNITKRLALGIAAATIAAAAVTVAAADVALAGEDSGSWSCATQGNKVCGPGHGPNTTAHNVYYGPGPLPYIPGRLTTWPDGTISGELYISPVFAASAAIRGVELSIPSVYTVQGSEQLSAVARKHGTTVAEIKSMNGFVDYPHALHAGDVLLIP